MNLLCQSDDTGHCVQCGRKIPLSLTQCVAARPPTVEPSSVQPPNLVRQAGSLCVATARWKKAGSPVRTQARILEVLAICQGCEHLRLAGTAKQHCGVCGCPVNGWLTTSGNKLALATEACPLQRPKWTAEPGVVD